jgi:putative hydrolase
MYFYGDYHMHTRASDGRGTLEQMAKAAMDKGLKEIAITDHGPSNIFVGIKSPDVLLSVLDYVRPLNQLYDGEFRILVGVEADVTSCDGEIDVPYEIYRQLDLTLVGLHPNIIPETAKSGLAIVGGNKLARIIPRVREAVTEINTKALTAAIKKHGINIVTHPGLGMPVDFKEVAAACSFTGCAFEINTGHNYIAPVEVRCALEQGARIIVNSDAHFPETVGELQSGWEVLIAAGAAPHQVVNLTEKGRKRLAELREIY